MYIEISGEHYDREHLRKLKVNKLMNICEDIGMSYKQYGLFLYKNRDILIDKIFYKVQANEPNNDKLKEFQCIQKLNEIPLEIREIPLEVKKESVRTSYECEEIDYSYEELIGLDYVTLGKLCVNKGLIDLELDDSFYNYSKEQLLNKLVKAYNLSKEKQNFYFIDIDKESFKELNEELTDKENLIVRDFTKDGIRLAVEREEGTLKLIPILYLNKKILIAKEQIIDYVNLGESDEKLSR
ncbi:hypothetical protein SAMN02745163_01184 [Clostridium cavendishii DSM 21758]|uniref:Uncharacterized protein n=1 Tax=Clostridium cavendishii DSM 21758 TaxID=1121302 RepID=A0A1M6FN18_9CLOT|nr:hypothetical protein [Clostridium cavendishii]SHI99070.1 hypothetical protein SAMN02745163_01184 [Clostridium cavendishii DSM 21758]